MIILIIIIVNGLINLSTRKPARPHKNTDGTDEVYKVRQVLNYDLNVAYDSSFQH